MARRSRIVRWGIVAALAVAGIVAWWLGFGGDAELGGVAPVHRPEAGRHDDVGDAPATPARGPAGPADGNEVECELTEALGPGDDVRIAEVDPDTLEPLVTHQATVDGAWIRFRPHRAEGLGWIRTRRHVSRALAWLDGACIDLVELEEEKKRVVSGTLEGQIEVGGVAVVAVCEDDPSGGFSGSVSAATGMFQLHVPPGKACDLRVRRVFVDQDLESEPYPLPAGDHDVDELVLETPIPPGSGMGLYPADGGLLVHDLELGSPAARAGVRKRDLVVTVDGELAEGLDRVAVQEHDEPMTIEVERNGALLEIHVPGAE